MWLHLFHNKLTHLTFFFSPTFPSQTQFIQFSKTLYNIFHGDPEEESLYRAVAHVTSLLLRMEEVGRRLQEPSSPPESKKPANTTAGEESSTEESSTTPESSDTSSSHNSQDLSETEWSFSFEQVLASLLNEPAIVSFFERPVDIQMKLGQAKVAQLKSKTNKWTNTLLVIQTYKFPWISFLHLNRVVDLVGHRVKLLSTDTIYRSHMRRNHQRPVCHADDEEHQRLIKHVQTLFCNRSLMCSIF